MAKTMKRIAVTSFILTVCFCLVYMHEKIDIVLSFAITCGTIAYHFISRLFVEHLFDLKMKNKMPTYDKETFDVSKHSWDEIIQAICQSELVHEANVIISFLPILAAIWFVRFGCS